MTNSPLTMNPNTLGALIARYRRECEAFNANPPQDTYEFNAVSKRTFLKTLEQMVGARALTKSDALAALSFIQEEIEETGDFDDVLSLIDAVRGYIER
jgi:hypothetical protein